MLQSTLSKGRSVNILVKRRRLSGLICMPPSNKASKNEQIFKLEVDGPRDRRTDYRTTGRLSNKRVQDCCCYDWSFLSFFLARSFLSAVTKRGACFNQRDTCPFLCIFLLFLPCTFSPFCAARATGRCRLTPQSKGAAGPESISSLSVAGLLSLSLCYGEQALSRGLSRSSIQYSASFHLLFYCDPPPKISPLIFSDSARPPFVSVFLLSVTFNQQTFYLCLFTTWLNSSPLVRDRNKQRGKCRG